MTYDEWADLVDRLNVRFPHQQIDEFTAQGWYDDQLHKYSAEQVTRALARCVGGVEFISAYALIEAIKEEQRERLVGRSTVLPLPARGVGMPPETKEAIGVLRRSMLLPTDPEHLSGEQARKRVDQLADYLDDRLAEGSTAPRRERPR